MNRPKAPGSFKRKKQFEKKILNEADSSGDKIEVPRPTRVIRNVKKESKSGRRSQSYKAPKGEKVVDIEAKKRSVSWDSEPKKPPRTSPLRKPLRKPPPIPKRKPSLAIMMKQEPEPSFVEEVEGEDENYGEDGYEEEHENYGQEQPDVLNISLPVEYSKNGVGKEEEEEEEEEERDYVVVNKHLNAVKDQNSSGQPRRKRKRALTKNLKEGMMKLVRKVKKSQGSSSGNSPSEKGVKVSKMSNSQYIRRILKFVSDQRFYIEEIDEKFPREFYRVYDLSLRQQLAAHIKLMTFSTDVVKKLFIKKHLCDDLIAKIRTQPDPDKEFLNLFVFLYLPGSSFICNPNAKYKYIASNETNIREFVRKYRDVLVAEPITFVKSFYFLEEKEVVKILERTNYNFSFTLEDCLYLLRHCWHGKVRDHVLTSLSKLREDEIEVLVKSFILLLPNTPKNDNLVQFLVSMSQRTISLWSTLNWEMILESEQLDLAENIEIIAKANTFKEYGTLFQKQCRLVEKITELSEELRKRGEKRRKKIEIFRNMLRDAQRWRDIFNLGREFVFLPFCHSDDKDSKLVGFFHEDSKILKSAKLPLLLTFRTVVGGKYRVLYKYGDDLRMDMFVMDMIRFMDRLLKLHNLDLDVVSYRVMGTSYKSGFIEIVEDCETMTQIKETYESVREFLMDCAGGDEEEFGEAVDRFKNSMAAYCVFSYLLGFGDRHLDNLMLSFSGHFFHVDFSFLFGKDPKPMPPKMRITKDMIEIMGGISGAKFMEFQILLCKIYNILRFHSYSIIAILNSIVGAKIPHVNVESVKFMVKRFQLNMKEEEANVHILSVFYKSLRSIFPKINETFHKIAMKIRD